MIKFSVFDFRIMLDVVQRNDFVHIEGMKRGRGRLKITQDEVARKDSIPQCLSENMALNRVEWRKSGKLFI